MIRPLYLTLGVTLVATRLLVASGSDVVFRSDVSLVRVDAQVTDRDNRAVTGLRVEDFVLRDEGRPQQIRNFAREEMPVDVLLLLDVSTSMRPHVERIASAAHQALRVLGNDDRVAIMVFDRSTRVRLPFRSSREVVEREFETLLRHENFRGGTDITRGLLDAADYVGRNARREARRAIVILTDDETEFERDDARVGRALVDADAVLSALIAPDAMAGRTRGQGRGGGGGGGSWPGGSRGPGLGGPLGDIILGRGGGRGGRSPGSGGSGGSRTRSAGTSEIARESGGDSLPVDDASALETTLSRLRQRYALHFNAPQGARPGQLRNLDVQLTDAALRRYPGAEVRFRRTYRAPDGPVVAGTAPAADTGAPPETAVVVQGPVLRRRAAVSEPDGARGPNASVGVPDQSSGTTPPAAPASTATAPAQATQQGGGWRKAKPGEQ
jgi:VWFA-related protein